MRGVTAPRIPRVRVGMLRPDGRNGARGRGNRRDRTSKRRGTRQGRASPPLPQRLPRVQKSVDTNRVLHDQRVKRFTFEDSCYRPRQRRRQYLARQS